MEANKFVQELKKQVHSNKFEKCVEDFMFEVILYLDVEHLKIALANCNPLPDNALEAAAANYDKHNARELLKYMIERGVKWDDDRSVTSAAVCSYNNCDPYVMETVRKELKRRQLTLSKKSIHEQIDYGPPGLFQKAYKLLDFYDDE